MKQPKILSYKQNLIFAAICLGVCPLASGGYVGLLWWISTSDFEKVWEGITWLIASIVTSVLLLLSLVFVLHASINLLKQHRALNQAGAARAQQVQNEMPPEEFFAAHRQTMMAVNEILLADAEQERKSEGFSYNWNFSDRDLRGNAYNAWLVALTEEQKQLFESLRGDCNFFQINLTPDTISYTFDSRRFYYVLQYSKSWETFQHLGGKWYLDRP